MAENKNGNARSLLVFRCVFTSFLTLIAGGAIFLSTSVYSGTIDRTKIDMRLKEETEWRKAHECITQELRAKRQAAEIRDVKMASSIEKIKEDVVAIKIQLACEMGPAPSSIPTTNAGTP